MKIHSLYFFTTLVALSCALAGEVSGELSSQLMPDKLEALPLSTAESTNQHISQKLVVRGILLIPNAEAVATEELERVHGVESRGINVPGGIAQLQRRLSPIILGQSPTKEKIIELKRAIILYYRDHHYPMVLVEVPPQDVTSGVLQIVVIRGKVGNVAFKGNRWFTDDHLRKYLDVDPGQDISTDVLLNQISWMNRNPFHHTDLTLTPGSDVGLSDLELRTVDRVPLRLYAGADNTGNDFTGNSRLYAGLNWGNAFGLGDLFSYQFTTSSDLHRFRSQYANYTSFLSWHHVLIVYGGYARAHPHHIKDFKSEGRSSQVSARYSIPLEPAYKSLLKEFTVGADFKNTNSDLFFTSVDDVPIVTHEVNITQLMAGYTLGKVIKKHELSFNIEGYFSPGELVPHQGNSDFNDLRHGAKNEYFYARLTAGDVWKLPRNFVLATLLRLQGATNALLPSEQFGLGGYNTVRGYEEREFNADDALCFNLELRTFPFSPWKRFKNEIVLLGFFDYGLGHNFFATNGDPASQSLISVGGGLRVNITRYLSARLDYGRKLHDTHFNEHGHGKFHMGVVFNY